MSLYLRWGIGLSWIRKVETITQDAHKESLSLNTPPVPPSPPKHLHIRGFGRQIFAHKPVKAGRENSAVPGFSAQHKRVPAMTKAPLPSTCNPRLRRAPCSHHGSLENPIEIHTKYPKPQKFRACGGPRGSCFEIMNFLGEIIISCKFSENAEAFIEVASNILWLVELVHFCNFHDY